jgi:hypothetical protein
MPLPPVTNRARFADEGRFDVEARFLGEGLALVLLPIRSRLSKPESHAGRSPKELAHALLGRGVVARATRARTRLASKLGGHS